ncbi:MAG: TIGR01777 family oxidoreductase [Opitutales bacterium]
MRVAVTGGTGLVGGSLVRALRERGDEVAIISRRSGPQTITWDVERGLLDAADLARFEAIVHLAGESISGRWTAGKKARVLHSRVRSTELLTKKILELPAADRPRHFISASAIGYYGPGPHAGRLNEDAPASEVFIAEVCRKWEAASEPLEQAGLRRVRARIGIVLSTKGGALKNMLLPFKLGLGGPLGTGTQHLPCIHELDMTRALTFCLDQEAFSGPVNCVSPEPVTSKEFAEALGKVVNRPAVLPAPAFALRLIFGEMADQLLLGDYPVVPERLQAEGFRFAYPKLPEMLEALLKPRAKAGVPAHA